MIGDIQNFSYTGAVQTATLLAGKRYKLELWGAQGGGTKGGKGGYACAEYTPAETVSVNLYVGQQPTTYVGGWNGGGNALSSSGGYSGGGATDIRIGGTALANRILVAGGGGGMGEDKNYPGGVGGGLVGADGTPSGYGVGGSGGTQSVGGANGGALGIGGATSRYWAGAGGGGFYGGGGSPNYASGGGGGSSFIGTLINGITTSGQQTGDGHITITILDEKLNQVFTQII